MLALTTSSRRLNTMEWSEMRCGTLILTIIFSLCLSPIASLRAEAQSLDGLGNVFESKQERYEREDRERQAERQKQRRLEASLRAQQEEMRRLEAEKARLLSQSTSSSPNAANSGSALQLYVVDDCPACLKTIGFLDALGLKYELLRVDKSLSLERLYRDKFGSGPVPVLDAGRSGGIIRGYQPAMLKKLASSNAAHGKLTHGAQNTKAEPKPGSNTQQLGSSTAVDNNSMDNFDVSSTLNSNEDSNGSATGDSNQQ